MLPMFRELPRAGTPLKWQDIRSAGLYAVTSGSPFAAAFARWLSVERVWVVSSGRAALCLILRELAKRSPRREVIIPAYTCPTVPLAVARAGLQVRLCDVDHATGNLDARGLAEAVGDETLAVVPVHMHGIPCDMRLILPLALKHGVFVVENCAQAAGATLDGQKIGSFGDASFFSLGRGKGFTAYEGGIGRIADSRLPIADYRGEITEGLAEGLTIAKLLAMAVFFHPRLYWLIRALPLGWDNEVYGLDFAISRMGRFRHGLALSLLGRLDEIVAERRQKAEYLRKQLRGVPGVQLLEPPVGSRPSYPWLPMLVEKRDKSVRRLRAKGLGAYRLFTCSLNQYEYLQGIVSQGSYAAAEYVAAHLITLPTHEYVTRWDMDQMVTLLAEVAF